MGGTQACLRLSPFILLQLMRGCLCPFSTQEFYSTLTPIKWRQFLQILAACGYGSEVVDGANEDPVSHGVAKALVAEKDESSSCLVFRDEQRFHLSGL